MKRRGTMRKKGQGLPMNTVVITILVILVLVVVAAFFLGGTSNLVKKVRGIFFESISGTDRVLAVQICQQRCDQLQSLPISAAPQSAYCRDFTYIDSDNDGEADYTPDAGGKKVYIEYYCWNQAGTNTASLDVPCQLEKDNRLLDPSDFCLNVVSPTGVIA